MFVMERLVKLEDLGQVYPLYTDASEEDIEEILRLVKLQIEKNSKSTKSALPASKAAVLTSLNMAGKYVSLRKDFEQYKQEMSELIERLTAVIENSLTQNGEMRSNLTESVEEVNKSMLAQNK
jgi:cell division protein ZapA (FtsZ GTPase activity inhibitor)